MKKLIIFTIILTFLALPLSVSAGQVFFEENCEDPMTGWDNHQGFGAGSAPQSNISVDNGVCKIAFKQMSCSSDCWANIITTNPISPDPFLGVTVNYTMNYSVATSSHRFTGMFFNSSTVKSTLLQNNTGSFSQHLRGDASTNSVWQMFVGATPTFNTFYSNQTTGLINPASTAKTVGVHDVYLWMNDSHMISKIDGVTEYSGTHTCEHCAEDAYFGLSTTVLGDVATTQWFDNLLIFEGQDNPTFPAAPNVSHPTYSGLNNNASTVTLTGGNVNFSVVMTANTGELDSYTFSWNDSGVFVNDSTFFWPTTTFGESVSYTSTAVTASAGSNVCGQFYLNESNGDENVTTLSCFTVASPPPDVESPQITGIANNASAVSYTSTDVRWQINVTDDTELANYVFSWNDTGSFVQDASSSISGTSAIINVGKTITATEGQYVCGRFDLNDTSANTNMSTDSCFTVIATPVPPTPASEEVPFDNLLQIAALAVTFMLIAGAGLKVGRK